ncbi:MAG: cation acetate symporter [Chloroflexi bacterium]|uniref:Cation acetate symporter n=1 Tax=Candidatus Chlorohelix allophototropha TaxID=3003348 RepID=A0A8T7M192_9CHLR|nr:cation acetate symporter [Chloroflexota bacterium]WJW67636.1 cation acetate symporter [Chloroflexota bacterium L227-S17]
MEINWLSVVAIVGVVLATISLGLWATRVVRTTSDFFVASRTVGPLMNAAAISGEYLSAASFMGIAGMVMKFGYDVLWYPVCYAAGYLFLLLFVAAPLRRFGAYTVPDYAEGRFNSAGFRKIAVAFVMIIGFFYMLPQMKGAGVTLESVLNLPYWVGVVVVGAVITLNVVLGGMKGITFVQAFQFWLKLFAISIPVFLLLMYFGSYGNHLNEDLVNNKVPRFTQTTTITYKAGSVLRFSAASAFVPTNSGRVELDGQPTRSLNSGEKYGISNGEFKLLDANQLTFESGQVVPNAPNGSVWGQPFGLLTGDSNENPGLSMLYTYSLIVAIVFGTAGLPHILVRFYTNTDGKNARHTTLIVLGMIGLFYMFPPILGVLGRNHASELYALGTTDRLVLELPGKIEPDWLSQILLAITAAGAFAAFMSTFSGLLVSVSGALSHDVYGRTMRPKASTRARRYAFRLSALLAGSAAVIAGLFVEKFDINLLVGWAFAIAASSLFPMLALGTWWRKLTKAGATSGVLLGGLSSSLSIVITMLLGEADASVGMGLTLSKVNPLVATLMAQPAIWSVPLSFITMLVVSHFTRKQIPADVNQMMLRLHAPEALGLRKDYINE